MKKIIETLMPFGVPDSHGDVLSKDCKITFAPGIKILEYHEQENGMRIITEIEVDEASMVAPKTFGFNVF